MGFERDRLPDPVSYFESQGLKLSSRGKWRTTECKFHGGSDSMRVNTSTGAWVCMSCGQKGGDVLAYEIAVSGVEFIEAAKALGAWVDDGRPVQSLKPTALSPRAALQVLAFEATLIAVAGGNIANGYALTPEDLARTLEASRKVAMIAEDFA